MSGLRAQSGRGCRGGLLAFGRGAAMLREQLFDDDDVSGAEPEQSCPANGPRKGVVGEVNPDRLWTRTNDEDPILVGKWRETAGGRKRIGHASVILQRLKTGLRDFPEHGDAQRARLLHRYRHLRIDDNAFKALFNLTGQFT